MSDPTHSWQYWHERGNDIYANDDMVEAQRCHRIATIMRGDVSRHSRFLYKIARNIGDARQANLLSRWIYVATNGSLDLPRLEIPPPDTLAEAVDSGTVTKAQEPSPERPDENEGAPPAMSVLQAAAPVGVLFGGLWVLVMLAAELSGLGATAMSSVGLYLPVPIGSALVAFVLAEVVAGIRLRARARTLSLAEAAMWEVPVHFEERLRRARTSRERKGLEQLDKFSRLFMPHPFAAFVRRRLKQSSIFAVKHSERIVSSDEYEFIGPQGTCGPAFPTDLAPDGQFRVLLIGGSVAEQMFSSEIPDFVSPLQTALQERMLAGGPKPEVWCGAVGGWTAVNFVPFAMTYGRRFHCIVSLFGYNEFTRRSMSSHAAQVFYDSVVEDAEMDLPAVRVLEAQIRDLVTELRSISRSFVGNLRVVVTRRLLFDLLERHAHLRRLPPKPNGPMAELIVGTLSDGTGESSLSETVQNIRSLQDFCARNGIALVNCLQPIATDRKPLAPGEQRMLDKRHAQRGKFEGYPPFIRSLLSELTPHTEIHDIGDVFQQTEEEIYLDMCHFTRDLSGNGPGSRLMANRLAELTIGKARLP